MTYDQYWNMDSTLVKYYRKADEIKSERKNQELWLQGMYVYEALCDVAPVLQAFAKKGTKVREYSSQPYSLKAKPKTKKEVEKIKTEQAKAKMEAYMNKVNNYFKGKGVN